MPELPEVETIKNILLPLIKNKTITKIEILRDKTIISNTNIFKNSLENQTFLNIIRKGKYLIFILTNNIAFISHLRMEGKYYLLNENEENSKYARIIFHLNTNEKLIYDDSRCFGIMKLSTTANYLKEKEIASLGKEPMDFTKEDIATLFKKCQNCNEEIKSTLLNQNLISGIGNIYADETLFKSFINPKDKTKDITINKWEKIIFEAKNTLLTAIKYGGSTIKSYHPGKGIDGNFQSKLLVYGKKDELCPRCNRHFRFSKINGRGTTFCPNCQKKTSKPFIVGIYGKIASGKSTVLKMFEEKDYPILSADEIVNELYKNEEIIRQINLKAKTNFINKVEKNILKEKMVSDKGLIRKINNLIHPLVKQKIKLFIKRNLKKDIIAIEIPLLFESGMEDLFDYIIGINISKENQYKRLNTRNNGETLSILKINENNHFDIYKNRMDFIINNDSNLDELKQQIEQIINKLINLQN